VLVNASKFTSPQAGQVFLKMKVDEHVVLPLSAYNRVLDVLDSCSYLRWITEFESILRNNSARSSLASIAASKDILLEHLIDEISQEIDSTMHAHNTLFRGNTALTKTAELFLAWYGRRFLEQSLGNTIRRICYENITIEVDLNRGGSAKDIERLIYWCTEVWTEIYLARSECPYELRRLFQRVRELVGLQHSEQHKNLHWQAVNAFCFLRFFIPAILNPHRHGLFPGAPDARVQRTLTLVAKTLQSLGNLNTNVQNEELMGGVKTFLEDSRPQMLDYIQSISVSHEINRTAPQSDERVMQQHALRVLRERKRNMPALQQEALPLPPHFIDVPLQLAIICISAMSRPASLSSSSYPKFGRLFQHLADIEKEALWRVSSSAVFNTDGLSLTQSSAASVRSVTSADHVLSDEEQTRGESLSSLHDRHITTLANPHTMSSLIETSTGGPDNGPYSVSNASSLIRSNHARSPSLDSSTSHTNTPSSICNSPSTSPTTESTTEITYEPKAKRTFLRNLGWK